MCKRKMSFKQEVIYTQSSGHKSLEHTKTLTSAQKCSEPCFFVCLFLFLFFFVLYEHILMKKHYLFFV